MDWGVINYYQEIFNLDWDSVLFSWESVLFSWESVLFSWDSDRISLEISAFFLGFR